MSRTYLTLPPVLRAEDGISRRPLPLDVVCPLLALYHPSLVVRQGLHRLRPGLHASVSNLPRSLAVLLLLLLLKVTSLSAEILEQTVADGDGDLYIFVYEKNEQFRADMYCRNG